jgi:hypothetical protein
MEPTGFAAFDRSLRLARAAREALVVALSGRLGSSSVELLTDEVLPHLQLVETGARLSMRSGRLSASGARALLRREAAAGEVPDPASPADRAPWTGAEHPLVADGAALEAAGLARVVLSLVPRLPRELTSWPGPGSYLDLRPPSDGVELVERVVELRRVVWRAASLGRLGPSGPARRTYAFFETATWLAAAGPRGFRGMGSA